MGTVSQERTFTSLNEVAENQLTPREAYNRVINLPNDEMTDHLSLLQSLSLDKSLKSKLNNNPNNAALSPLLSARILMRLFITHQACTSQNIKRFHRQIQSILEAKNEERIEALIACYRDNLTIPILHIDNYLTRNEKLHGLSNPIDKAFKVLNVFLNQIDNYDTPERREAQQQFYKKVKTQILTCRNNLILTQPNQTQQVLSKAIKKYGRTYFKHRHAVLRSKSVSICFAVLTLFLAPLIRRTFFASSWLPCNALTRRTHEALDTSAFIFKQRLRHPMRETESKSKSKSNLCNIQ